MSKQISIQIINQFLSSLGTFLFLQGTALSLVWMFPEPAPATVRCGTETAPKVYSAFSALFPVRGGVSFNWGFPSPRLRTTKTFVSSTLLLIGYISFNDESHPLPWIIPYFRSNCISICGFVSLILKFYSDINSCHHDAAQSLVFRLNASQHITTFPLIISHIKTPIHRCSISFIQ